MSSAPADDPLVPMDIRGARVSTVVVQRVPADRVQRFLECQRGLTQAAESFPGYQGTELYPPADDRHRGVGGGHPLRRPGVLAALDRLAGTCRVDQEAPRRNRRLPTQDLAVRFRCLVRRAGHGAGRRAASLVENGDDGAAGTLSHRHAARLARRAIPESPGNGCVDADRQHTQRGHQPVGRDAAADERARPLAPCQCARTRGFFRSAGLS